MIKSALNHLTKACNSLEKMIIRRNLAYDKMSTRKQNSLFGNFHYLKTREYEELQKQCQSIIKELKEL